MADRWHYAAGRVRSEAGRSSIPCRAMSNSARKRGPAPFMSCAAPGMSTRRHGVRGPSALSQPVSSMGSSCATNCTTANPASPDARSAKAKDPGPCGSLPSRSARASDCAFRAPPQECRAIASHDRRWCQQPGPTRPPWTSPHTRPATPATKLRVPCSRARRCWACCRGFPGRWCWPWARPCCAWTARSSAPTCSRYATAAGLRWCWACPSSPP